MAEKLGLKMISDLAKLPAGALMLGLSREFQVRADGWPALQKAYWLRLNVGAALDHGLAYEAVKAGQVDSIDICFTDAKVGRYALRVVVDDRNFFPRYDAVLLMRSTLDAVPLRIGFSDAFFPSSWRPEHGSTRRPMRLNLSLDAGGYL